MKLPKILFRPMTIEENIEIIKWAYFENNDVLNVHDYTLNCFPDLREIDKSYSKKDIMEKIEEIVTKDYIKYKKEIYDTVKKYNMIWEPLNDKYMLTISNYLNIKWPDKIDIIDASVGLIPVFPRYLDTYSFSISLNANNIIETAAHESLHFLWFEKWKKLYPNWKRKEFDSPYLPWIYSEMVVDAILNSNDIKKVLNINAKAYDNFYELNYNNSNVMKELNDIFSSSDSIEDKIRKGYKYVELVYKDKEHK